MLFITDLQVNSSVQFCLSSQFLHIIEDNAVASSKELPEWFLFLRAYEEKKMLKLQKNKKEDTLTINMVLGMLKYKDRCFKT
jgi:hypothetical protein